MTSSSAWTRWTPRRNRASSRRARRVRPSASFWARWRRRNCSGSYSCGSWAEGESSGELAEGGCRGRLGASRPAAPRPSVSSSTGASIAIDSGETKNDRAFRSFPCAAPDAGHELPWRRTSTRCTAELTGSPPSMLEDYVALCATLRQQLAESQADQQMFEDTSRELQEELERDFAALEKSERDVQAGWERSRADLDDLQVRGRRPAIAADEPDPLQCQAEGAHDHAGPDGSRARLDPRVREGATNQIARHGARQRRPREERTVRNGPLCTQGADPDGREKDSSLQDLEAREGRAIERIALLEDELVNKAALEEEIQRLKDDLRDQGEELEVLRSHNATLSARPVTPSLEASTASSTTTSSPTPSTALDHAPATPTKDDTRPTSSNRDSPSISLTSATPRLPTRTSSIPSGFSYHSPPPPLQSPISPPPPVPIIRATPLNRSFRGPPVAPGSSTPVAVREGRKSDNLIKGMKGLSDRVRSITSRKSVMVSSIPRPSMSPGRTSELKRMNSLGVSISNGNGRPSRLREEEVMVDKRRSRDLSAESAALDNPVRTLSRQGSRAALRMSISGGTRTSIPVPRPSSRLSMAGNPPPLPISRSTTPTPGFPPRSSTPSSLSIATRKPWGAPSNPPASTANPLAQSTRRRISSAYGGLSVSTSGRGPPSGRASVDLGASTRGGETGTAPGVIRRSSIAGGLGKSIRKPT